MINRIKSLVSAFFLSFFLFSCVGPVDPTPGGPGDKPDPGKQTEDISVINGTEIQTGMNLVGLISDAKTGKGIAGVPVTDGYKYVLTDANGVYQLKGNRFSKNVYYSTPAGYEISVNASSGTPEFYSTRKIDYYEVNRNDFKLTPLSAPEEEFTLIMIGDPQCQKESEVARYKNETIADIINTVNTGLSNGSVKSAYALTLGDVTYDNSAMWAPMKQSMSNIRMSNGEGLRFFNCIGNHDHNSNATSGDEAATEEYVKHFGPTDYSFNRGNAHIVVIDNVLVTKPKSNSSPNGSTWEYNAGLTDAKMNWLTADLNTVKDKANTLVILCAHIPFRAGASSGGSTMNKDKHYEDVLRQLTEFKEAHIMIGHTHYAQNYIHNSYKCRSGLPVYEHIHGGACGSWWATDSDVTGGPNGYNVYTVSGAGIREWYNKGTNRSRNFQLRVYDGNQKYTGTKHYEYTWYGGGVGGSANIKAPGNAALKGCFVAQIWDDDDANWKVELYQGGNKVGNFSRLPNGTATNIAYSAFTFNEKGKNTDTWTNKTASHYWYFKPLSATPSKETDWEVRATHKFPGSGIETVYTCSSLTTDYSSF